MAEVKVTLSDEMVTFLEGIYETQQKLAAALLNFNKDIISPTCNR